MAEFFTGKSPQGDSIRIRESDGSPDIANVSDLIVSVPNLILTDNGSGTATLTAAGGGGGSGTVQSITAGTGLDGGTITVSGTIDLADTAVTAGNYLAADITVDAQGRITAASSNTDFMRDFLVTGDSGGNQTVRNNNILYVAGGTGISTVSSDPGVITVTVSLDNTSVSAGSYTNADITVDAQGRITAASSGSAGSGTVTSVDVSGGSTGLTYSGGPITTSGTITMAGTLSVANGGTGSTTASGARTNLGLGTMATQDSDSVNITGGTITGVSGVGSPSVGVSDQFNVADGSGGWDSASVFYSQGGNGAVGIGSGVTITHGLTVFFTASNVAKFKSNQSVSTVIIESTSATNGKVGLKASNNALILMSNSVDFSMPTADGTNGQVLATDGSGTLSFTTVTPSPIVKTTGSYAVGDTDIDFAIPTGTRNQVACQITIYLEDGTSDADSAMVIFDAIVQRAGGAPLAPDLKTVVVPGKDGDRLAMATGGANTVRITLTGATNSGNYVASCRFTED